MWLSAPEAPRPPPVRKKLRNSTTPSRAPARYGLRYARGSREVAMSGSFRPGGRRRHGPVAGDHGAQVLADGPPGGDEVDVQHEEGEEEPGAEVVHRSDHAEPPQRP